MLAIGAGLNAYMIKPNDLTPVQTHGGFLVKRDDLFVVAGVCGGKARQALWYANGAAGLVSAGARTSQQVNIMAHIAQHCGIPSRAHIPSGKLEPEMLDAQACGCTLVQHRPGYSSVIRKRARDDAAARPGWREIPFGMECQAAIDLTRAQVCNLIDYRFNRIVVPIGSGMSVAGILWGMQDYAQYHPVLGLAVGADPTDRLLKWAPPGWESRLHILQSETDYHERAKVCNLGAVQLDPIYEAKLLPLLEPGDLMWIIGNRAGGKL